MKDPAAVSGLGLVWRDIFGRRWELLVWLGIPMVGAAAGEPTLGPKAIIWLLAMISAMLHLLLLNDWGGLIINPREASRLGFRPDQSPSAAPLAIAALVALAVAVALLAWLSPTLALLGLAWGALSGAYSHPRLHLKGRLLGAGIVHLAGGELLFAFGHVWAGGDLESTLGTGTFFALILLAGSFNHQATDRAEDTEANTDTLAGRWGAGRTGLLAGLTFMVAHGWLVALALGQMIHRDLAVAFGWPAVVHLAMLVYAWRHGTNALTSAHLRRYRLIYRAGVALAAAGYIVWRLPAL